MGDEKIKFPNKTSKKKSLLSITPSIDLSFIYFFNNSTHGEQYISITELCSIQNE
jgi:hypothetical protein